MPSGCTADCAAVYLPFYSACAGFLAEQMPSQAATFAAINAECQSTASGSTTALYDSCNGDTQCRINTLEQRLSAIPVTWWQGDGSIFIGRQQTALQFAPCQPVFLYDAGVTTNPVDCLNGLPGTSEVELDPNHDYPLSPINGCPPNPTSGAGGGWDESAPSQGEHYFSNVLSGDLGGLNSWGKCSRSLCVFWRKKLKKRLHSHR